MPKMPRNIPEFGHTISNEELRALDKDQVRHALMAFVAGLTVKFMAPGQSFDDETFIGDGTTYVVAGIREATDDEVKYEGILGHLALINKEEDGRILYGWLAIDLDR